ncbi:MAG: two pore domain potassium channel family protein [Lachnospiraceae bacterium]|jgi:voltage-gated potassium channel|nr:two pore domain potassium channel family protein [Lachnospiraceae bacterium]
MKAWRRCYKILKRTGTLQIFMSFLLFLCGASFVLVLAEPAINTFGDGLWYCFVAATTIGFGDIYAVTGIGRFVTVIVGIYGILMTAMVPGVVVSYYMEYLKVKEKETISVFLEKLERLPELSKEELEQLSQRIREFERK